MKEISEIDTKKAVSALFGDKKEKRHKLDYLQQIWDTVAQTMGYSNYQADDLARKYMNYFSSRREEFYPELKDNPNKGLLVMGDVGTGKSTNFKIYQRIYNKICTRIEGTERILPPMHTANDDTFHFVHVKRIEHDLRIEGEESIQRLVKIKKLVIDDLGVDADDLKDYGTSRNPVIDVINHRYEKMYQEGLVTHFTTNLNGPELKKKYGDRNIDRLKEMTITIGVKGESKRV